MNNHIPVILKTSGEMPEVAVHVVIATVPSFLSVMSLLFFVHIHCLWVEHVIIDLFVLQNVGCKVSLYSRSQGTMTLLCTPVQYVTQAMVSVGESEVFALSECTFVMPLHKRATHDVKQGCVQ